MIKKCFPLAIALVLAVFTTSMSAQTLKTPAPSPTQTLTQDFALGQVTISYSRPGVKDRVIFDNVVAYGKIWRTGANAATKITFSDKVKVEGKEVAAGTYAIYTIPNKDNWEVMLYSDLKLGGNVDKYDAANEVLRVKVKPQTLKDKVETLTINLDALRDDSARLEIVWENTRVPVQITAEIDSAIMKNIQTAVVEDHKPYYQAARYYLDNDKDLKMALEWINKAIEGSPKAPWVMMVKANIELKMGDKKAALATAEKAKTLATDGNYPDYIRIAGDFLTANGGK